jgi:hypothetical protein
VARRYHEKMVAAATFTYQATVKCIKALKTRLCFLKSEGPLKLKKSVQRNNSKSKAID